VQLIRSLVISNEFSIIREKVIQIEILDIILKLRKFDLVVPLKKILTDNMYVQTLDNYVIDHLEDTIYQLNEAKFISMRSQTRK
jgi:hypothetical protein